MTWNLSQWRRPAPKKQPPCRPGLEALEQRWLPTGVGFTAATAYVYEYMGGLSLSVALDQSTSQTVTVDYATSNGTAAAGSDYTAASGSLAFYPGTGVTSQSIWVSLTDDNAEEGQEVFYLTLSNPGGASLGTNATMAVYIDENDVSVRFTASAYSVAEAGGQAVIGVTLPYPVKFSLSVDYATSNGTAVAGSDYTAVTGTLTFAPLQTSATFTVPVTSDSLLEANETVGLSLALPVSVSLGTPAHATLTIVDDDLPSWATVGGGFTAEHRLDDCGCTATGPVTPDLGSVLGSLGATRGAPALPQAQTDAARDVSFVPTLVYRSDLAAPRPAVVASVPTTAAKGVPTSITVTLTWDGSAQAGVSYTPAGSAQAGDTYGVAAAVSAAIAASGHYPYTVSVTIDYAGSAEDETYGGVGYADVAVQGPAPFGYGWSLEGQDPPAGAPDGERGPQALVALAGGSVLLQDDTAAPRYFEKGVSGFTSPPRDRGTLTQNGDGTYTYARPDQARWNFDSSGKLASRVSASGQVTTLSYDGSGQLQSVTDPGGAATTFGYSGGYVTSITRPGGAVFTLSYAGGDLASVQDPGGALHSFGYSGHRLTSEGAGGVSATFAYDGSGQPAGVTLGGASWAVTTQAGRLLAGTAYPAAAAAASLTDPLGRTTTAALDAGGLASLATPDGAVQRWTRNAAGQPLTFADGGNHTTTYGYSAGDLTTLTDALGRTTTYSYDATYHKVTVREDPLGGRTTYAYDAATGNLLTETDPDGGVTTYAWADGLLQSVTDPNGRVTSYAYEASRRLQTVQQPTGELYTYSYDAAGHPAGTLDAAGARGTTLFDALGRLTMSVAPGGGTATYAYDGAGRLTGQTDPVGNRTDYGYDGAGRRVSETAYAGTASARTATVLYDAAGNVTGNLDAHGQLTQYLVDAAGRASVTVDPFGNRATTLYDAAGNATGGYDRYGHLTQYQYDALNRLTVTVDAFGQRTTSLFDPAGNLTGSYDSHGQLTRYLYDASGRQTVVIDVYGNRTTTLLDAAGQVTGVRDPFGQLTQYVYDVSGRQTVVIDPFSRRTTTLYNGSGQVTGVLDTRGGLAQYLYDGYGRQTVVVDALSGRATTLLDGLGRVTGSLDARNNLTQYLYDALGRQTVVVDALGGRATTLLDAFGQVTGTLDANSHLTQFVYDGYGRQTVVIDAEQGRSTTLFDSSGRVTGGLDARGGLIQYVYDGFGRQTVTVDELGGRATTLFDSSGQVTGALDARNKLTQFLYDGMGRQTVVVDAEGGRSTTLFDGQGQVTGALDALGHLSQYVFDAYGRQTVVVDGAGGRVTTLYDNYGLVTGTLDARNTLTRYAYDALGRQVAVTQAAGTAVERTVTTLYDAAGNVTASINGRGYETDFVYDALDRQTVTIDPLGHRTTTLLDAAGNVTGVRDARNQLTQYGYDGLNRRVIVTDALGKTATTYYDAAGGVTGVRDANNLLTQYRVDALGRTTVTVDPRGYRTSTLYDAAGNVTSLTDAAGNTTTFAYDGLGRKTAQTDALNHTATFAYDAGGLLASATDPLGQRRDFQYDAANRLTAELWYSAGGGAVNTLSYSYDASGNKLTASDDDGTYTLTYDALNRVGTVQDLWGITQTFTYDAADNRTGVQDSLGGLQTSTYDAANRLTWREQSASGATIHLEFTYTARNETETVQRYSGTVSPFPLIALTSYSYDARGQLTHLQHTNGSGGNVANYTYTYDDGGRLTGEVRDGTTTSCTYDDSSQLTGDGSGTYSYDGAGNRTMSGYGTGTGNRLTTDGTWTYTYDDAGNLTKKSKGALQETWTYGYDNRNELTWAEKRATDGGTLQERATYKYDAFGSRVEKDVDSDGNGTIDVTQKYALDGWDPAKAGGVGTEAFDVWADLDGTGALTTRYLRGDVVDQLFARISSGGAAYWTLADRLGSVGDVVDNSGVVKDSIRYDGYGNVTSESDALYGGRYKYTSREYDAETGLQYNRARYYDAGSGRWISQDPLGFDAGDSNLYRYVNNRPTIAIDASGQQLTPAERLILRETNKQLAGQLWAKIPIEKIFRNAPEVLQQIDRVGQLRVVVAAPLVLKAERMSFLHFPNERDRRDGYKSDAWRHAFWSALMATSPGLQEGVELHHTTEVVETKIPAPGGLLIPICFPRERIVNRLSFPAYEIGHVHEEAAGGNRGNVDYEMDLHNNNVGLAIGRQLGIRATEEQIIRAVDKAMADRNLIWRNYDQKMPNKLTGTPIYTDVAGWEIKTQPISLLNPLLGSETTIRRKYVQVRGGVRGAEWVGEWRPTE